MEAAREARQTAKVGAQVFTEMNINGSTKEKSQALQVLGFDSLTKFTSLFE